MHFGRFIATMSRITLSILIILLSLIGYAQKSGQTDFELGVSGGVSWYNGDLNPTGFWNTNYMHRAYGISLRRNLNQRFALRSQFNVGRVSADDKLSTATFQQSRNLNFQSEIYELSTTVEFNFHPFDALVSKYRFSPFTFVGLAGFHFNPTTEIEGSLFELRPLQTEDKAYKQIGIAIPFGFGLKLAVTDRILLSADWGLRRTFTDYLDDVSDRYPLESEIEGVAKDISDRSLTQAGPDGSNWGTQRGDPTNKDWYSFATATLSVRLGPKKGSCKHLRI